MTRRRVFLGVALAGALGVASVLFVYPQRSVAQPPVDLSGDRLGTGYGPPKYPGLVHRQIPVLVEAIPSAKVFQAGERLLVTLRVHNRLPAPISFASWSVEPNDWNGETGFRSAVNIRREGEPTTILLARPQVSPPPTMAGYGCHTVQPREYFPVTLDLSKWTVSGGWKPGKYTVAFRMEQIKADDLTTMSVMSEPVSFEIRG